ITAVLGAPVEIDPIEERPLGNFAELPELGDRLDLVRREEVRGRRRRAKVPAGTVPGPVDIEAAARLEAPVKIPADDVHRGRRRLQHWHIGRRGAGDRKRDHQDGAGEQNCPARREDVAANCHVTAPTIPLPSVLQFPEAALLSYSSAAWPPLDLSRTP